MDVMLLAVDAPLRPRLLERRLVEAVSLGLYAVRHTPLYAEVGRRTAVDLRRVLGEARLALLRLEVAPVERHCRQIEGGG